MPHSSSPPRWPSRLLHGLAWLMLAVGLCIAAGWASLHWWIVPRIDAYRPTLETWASRAVGLPVQIGSVQAQSNGWMPTFELRDVALHDAQGQRALTLPRMVVAISIRSALGLDLEQLVLDRPVVDVRRDAAGAWTVAGLPIAGGRAKGAAADWLFDQKEVLVRGATLRWRDALILPHTLPASSANVSANAVANAFEWRDIDVVLRNGQHRHDLRVDITPPAAWGERFVVMGQFTRGLLSRHPGRWQDWSGQAYGYWPGLDLAAMRSALRAHLPAGVDPQSGRGRVRLWADLVRGQWRGASLDVDVQALRVQLQSGLQALDLPRLSARIAGQRGLEQWSLQAQHLELATGQGERWQGGRLAVSQRQDKASSAKQGTLQGSLEGEQWNLQALREIALRLPLPQTVRQPLSAYQLRGWVRDVQLHWQRPDNTASSNSSSNSSNSNTSKVPVFARATGYRGQVAVEGLHIEGQGRGLSGVNLKTSFDERGGTLQADVPDGGWLAWPDLIEAERLPLQQLNAQAQWTLEGQRLAALHWTGRLRNADLQGQSQGQWSPATQGGGAGVLDVSAQIDRAQAQQIWRYLPTGLPEPVRQYLRQAVRQGQVQDVQVRLKGDVSQPLLAGGGESSLRIAGQLRDVALDPVPSAWLPAGSRPWPALEGLNGELVLDGDTLRLHSASARLGSNAAAVQLSALQAQLSPLHQQPQLRVQTAWQGPAAQALQLVNHSALNDVLSGALAQTQATGALQGQLQLTVPLHKPEQTQVQGTLALSGNDVQWMPGVPRLGQAHGSVQFSEKGFALQGVQAQLLGGTVRLDGGLRSAATPGGPAQFMLGAQGQISAEGLRGPDAPAALQALGQHMQGQTSYSASLGGQGAQTQWSVRSTLEGLALNLPAPLLKTAEQSLPLLLSQSPAQAESAAGVAVTQDMLKARLGDVLAATYVRDVSGPQPRVLRGQVYLGDAGAEEHSALPDEGVAALVRLQHLSVDDWQALLPASTPDAGVDAAVGAAVNASVNTAVNTVTWRSYLPQRLGVQTERLTVQGRTLHEVVAGITREDTLWRANVDAQELSGHAQWTAPDAQQPGRLYARLARLNLPPAAVSDVESLMDAAPRSMPELDIEIDDVQLRGKPLGRVEIQAVNQMLPGSASAVREWRLKKFNVSVPEAQLQASGHWVSGGSEAQPRRTEMDFKLQVQDAGALLTRLGMPDVLRSGKGLLQGQVGWQGSPLSLHYPSMQGQLRVDMGAGQFLKADPGVAKLLGVLSLQGLPRRLLLDFRDVFYEGFAFDQVQGDVQIDKGIASTSNLKIDSVNAAVQMVGSANLAQETQALRVLILPQVNAGGASVLAGLAINPIVGLTSYITQWLLSRPIMHANIQEFTIDGTWSEPRVTRIRPPLTPEASASSTSTTTRATPSVGAADQRP